MKPREFEVRAMIEAANNEAHVSSWVFESWHGQGRQPWRPAAVCFLMIVGHVRQKAGGAQRLFHIMGQEKK